MVAAARGRVSAATGLSLLTASHIMRPMARSCLSHSSTRSSGMKSSGAMPMAPVVMSSLTQLQQSGLGCGATSGSPEPVAGSNMAPPNVLREIRSLGLVPTLDQAGDMTLDIVAMLFDYILDDKNLPDPVRMLIGRLQIPVLKVALISEFVKASPDVS